ncbi:GNAT family N-acetyltransferase [Shimazuella sp. AN120528]|uniref:GNAT family N-acetyltransferase n=1 Tax=Shimazuella soli TaxID=1892854 RepID=UPI001F0FAC4A|nr:GNAT family protein [Shimazuella soli]MCH5586342.1 GNAT family N-acetyltransferase [Shimazuella soli]
MFSIIVNEEIELRLLQPKNAKEIFQLVNQSRLYLGRFLPWVNSVTSPEDYKEIIPSWLQQFAENKGFQSGIYYQGAFAGMIGFHPIDWNTRMTAIGYWLAEEHQGKGIMTRCCKKMIEMGFQDYELNRLEIRCDPANEKSRAIPERLGFIQEGVLREVAIQNEEHHDLVVYGLLKSEYKT